MSEQDWQFEFERADQSAKRLGAKWKEEKERADRLEVAYSQMNDAFIAAEDERQKLRQGIQDYLDGNYEGPHSGRAKDPRYKCRHDRPYWEACDSCIDEHFADLLEDK